MAVRKQESAQDSQSRCAVHQTLHCDYVVGTNEKTRFRLSLVGLIATAMMLGGCAKLGPDFVRPEAPVAQDWMDATDPKIKKTATADYSEWWKTFNDPMLDALVEAAYQQNLSLKIAGVRILEARAQLGVATGSLYPQQQQAFGAFSANEISESAPNIISGLDRSYRSAQLGLDTAWELDFWGRFSRGIESADANFLASIANYDDVLVLLASSVADAYVRIRTLEARLRIAQQNVAIQQRSLRIADVRFRNGATTELDVQQARTLLRQTQATVPALRAQLRQAKNALSILLGMPPSDLKDKLAGESAIPVAPSEILVGIPAELLRRRPDVRRAELVAARESADVGFREADLYPRFSLFGTIGFESSDALDADLDDLFDSRSFTFGAGPVLTWNIFNYGRIKNSVRVEDAQFQRSLVEYQNTVLRAAQEVEDAMVGFLRAQEQVGFLAGSVTAARRSVDLSLVQYRDGAVDYQRVLDSQERLVARQDELTSSQGDISRNLIAMYKALGGGWEIREGKDFVPADIKETMRNRTDWGGLLAPEATDAPVDGKPSGDRRAPDW